MTLKELQNSWHSLVDSIRDGLLGFVSALAENIEKNGGQVLRDAALAAVKAAEANGGSGSDKFNAALESVISTLEQQGIPVVINAVRGAIEAAVAQIKTSN